MFIWPSLFRNAWRVIQTKVFTLSHSEEKELTSLQKKQLQKTFSPVCMLSVQLVSMNVFTPRDNWKTLFFTKMFRCSEVFVTAIFVAYFHASALKEVRNL